MGKSSNLLRGALARNRTNERGRSLSVSEELQKRIDMANSLIKELVCNEALAPLHPANRLETFEARRAEPDTTNA